MFGKLFERLKGNREIKGFLTKTVYTARLLSNSKLTKVLDSVGLFSDIDFDGLIKSGKRGFIFDVDETLAEHHGEIFPEYIKIIEGLMLELDESGNPKKDDEGNFIRRKGEDGNNLVEIVIYSNMKHSDRYAYLEKIGVKVNDSKYAKPDKRGFDECVEILGIYKKQIVTVGDNYVTDGGSTDAGIDFIKVYPIITNSIIDDIKGLKLGRATQVIMRYIVDKVARARGDI